MEISPTDPVGIALIVIGAFVAFRVARTLLKVLMIVVVAAGLFLWLGVG